MLTTYEYGTITQDIFLYGDVQGNSTLLDFGRIQITNFIPGFPYVAEEFKYSDIRANEFAGEGYIAGIAPGIVTFDGLPAIKELELRDRATRKVVQVVNSKRDGSYSFDRISPLREFDIIARDGTRTYTDIIIPAIVPWRYSIYAGPKFPAVSNYSEFEFIRKVEGATPPYTLGRNDSSNTLVTLENTTLTIKSVNSDLEANVDFDIMDSSGRKLTIAFKTKHGLLTRMLKLNPHIALAMSGDTSVEENLVGEQDVTAYGYSHSQSPHYPNGDRTRWANSDWCARMQAPASIFPATYKSFSVALMYRISQKYGAYRLLVGQTDASTQTWQFRTTYDNMLEFVTVNNGSAQTITTDITLDPNQPYMIILTVNENGTLDFYVNSIHKTMSFSSPGMNFGHPTAPFSLGGFANCGYYTYWSHGFGNFAFYDRVLTQNEIDSLLEIQAEY